MRYAIITPARNEVENLPILAACVADQTLSPDAWLIVDNGSTDDTVEVAEKIARDQPWVRVIDLPGTTEPTRGGPVVRAFQFGVATLSYPVDVVIKLDADVTFGPEYFEGLLAEFGADPSLGMASGVGYQFERGKWRLHNVTAGHVWGPVRAYRWACLADVLPLEEATGWDAIDEVKARLAGWKSSNFPDLRFRHHRPVGLRDGTRRRQWIQQGRSAYFIGYRPTYLILRAVFRSRQEPWALAMIWGYFSAAMARAPRCADPRARAYIRRQQRIRALGSRAVELFGTPGWIARLRAR